MNPLLADLAYATAWRALRAVPERVAVAVMRALVGRADTAGLRANLAHVVPPAALDAVVAEALAGHARYWCEAFRLGPGDAPRLLAGSHVTRPEPFYDALDAGRGLVVALPHCGNWDAAGVWLVETLRRRGREPRFTTVALRVSPPSLYRRFVAYRERLGFEVVAADDPGAYRALLARLRAGGVVCLVADRDLAGSGVEVSFCGAPATLPSGPARLAALTGAALVPSYLGFRPGGWTIAFADPVPVPGPRDVAKATQALADALGVMIARSPADWHVLQPVWTAGR